MLKNEITTAIGQGIIAMVAGLIIGLSAREYVTHVENIVAQRDSELLVKTALIGAQRQRIAKLESYFSMEVRVTAYSATPEETDSDPWNTSIMRRPRPGTIAASLDVLRRFGYGTKAWAKGDGVFIINDHMPGESCIDIFMSKEDAEHFTPHVTTLVKIFEG